MGRVYDLFADEAWTHGGDQRGRYWCFYGGIFGPHAFMEALEKKLKAKVTEFGTTQELKWGNLSPRNVDQYKELVDFFLSELQSGPAVYRQMFLDRAFPHLPHPSERRTPLDAQFIVYYQFLKHHFEFQSLPEAAAGSRDEINIWLDNHSSQKHLDSLTNFASGLPRIIDRHDLRVVVRFVDSNRHIRLQMCDILMGAAGSYGNRMHKRRLPGVRRMTKKQKCRKELGKYIYDKLRAVDAHSRGSKAFNWFESTGRQSTHGNATHLHKIRIWKFTPKNHQIIEGWRRWTATGEFNHHV